MFLRVVDVPGQLAAVASCEELLAQVEGGADVAFARAVARALRAALEGWKKQGLAAAATLGVGLVKAALSQRFDGVLDGLKHCLRAGQASHSIPAKETRRAVLGVRSSNAPSESITRAARCHWAEVF